MTMEKTFDPSAVEARISAAWENAGAFRAGRTERKGAAPFSIVIPPPNVTGSLHMGHALNNTLQDVLARFERMRGKDVLWQPGTDHAGIATQMVVERQLMERQEPGRRDMGREKFLERVWAWKAESGGTIVGQLKRLGASCDWSRERFTMDEGLSRAVAKVFVQLYRDGLIYKDKRLVNWDPKLQTAVSDIEVVQIDCKGSYKWTRDPAADAAPGTGPLPFDAAALAKALARDPNGHLYYFDYPLEDGTGHITVATTRPETMLGDTAVAVHPENETLKHLIGKNVRLPLAGRLIPIVGDEYADPEKGTGAVKITPAHDFNDFEVGKRHSLPLINILDGSANVTLRDNAAFLEGLAASPDAAIAALDGQPRDLARKIVVDMIAAQGLLAAIEPHAHTVPHGDRSEAVIEPWLTDQWYVDAKTLAGPALAAVREGQTSFVPKNWEKTYFEWLDNIQPWCISRQLWWGHQIPAWYAPWGEVYVAETAEEALADALADAVTREIYDDAEAGRIAMDPDAAQTLLTRDEDVLDTWFSSALWPFSTMGWPDDTPELHRFYPTSVLVTGFDIIFFWVARMMMMGMHVMNEIPFRDVYIHALVRDEKGAKMSKSKGNVMDPLDIIDGISLDELVVKRVASMRDKNEAKRIASDTKRDYPKGIAAYGADALRFTLAAMAAQGRDIKLSTARVEGYRNFATKLWNAARFAEMNGCARAAGFDPRQNKVTLNRWVVGEASSAAAAVTAAIEGYRFNEAAGAIYRFVWNVFCDWHLELAKPLLLGEDEAAKAETRATIAFVLDQIVKLLHPFMPFLTEELWAVFEGRDPSQGVLALAAWPDLSGLADPAAEEEIGWLVDLVSEVRSIRAEMNVPASAQAPLFMINPGETARARIEHWSGTIQKLARVSGVFDAAEAPSESTPVVLRGGGEAALPFGEHINVPELKAKFDREIAEQIAENQKSEGKLANEDFLKRAPEDIVEENRERLQTGIELIAKLRKARARLPGA